MEKKKVKDKSYKISPLEEVRKKKPLLGRGWGGSSASLVRVGEASDVDSIGSSEKTSEKHNVIYLTHGEKHFLEEAYFSIVSLCNQETKIHFKIHVYTDQPGFFKSLKDLDINFHVLDEKQITVWKGEFQFIHRLKVKVLIDMCEKFPDEKYLFLDSDTFVTDPIDSIFQKLELNQFILDYDEGFISQKKRTHIKDLYHLLKKNKSLNIKLHPDLRMWNSGVIGLDYSNSIILNDILKTTDLLTSKTKSHILEQFAFAYHFQKQGQVGSSSDAIHHYWYFKEMRQFIGEFIDKNKFKPLREQVHNIQKLNPKKIAFEKWNYKQGSFWDKLLFRLTHFRKWKLHFENIHEPL